MQRANLTELIAGKRQSDTLNAVLSNSATLTSALTTSLESEGSALEENAKYMDSITAKTELFTKALQDLWTNAVDSNAIKGIVDFGTTLITVADNLDLVNVGLSIFFAWLVKILATKAISFFSTLSGQIYAAGGGLKGLGSALSGVASSLKGGLITAAIAAVIYGVTKAIEKLKELEQTYQDLKTESDSYVKTFVDNKDSILSMVDSLSKAQEGSEEYYDVSNKLAKLLPEIVDYVDDEGNAHLKTSEYIDKHINSLEELSESYKESIKVDFTEEIALLEDLSTQYEALNKKINSYEATFGRTPVIFGQAVDKESIELTPELKFQQEYLDFQARLVYEQIRDSLVDQVVAGTDTDSQFSDALSNYIGKQIAGMDVSTPENIAKVGGIALKIAQEFNESLEGLDVTSFTQKAKDIADAFNPDVIFADSPQAYDMLRDKIVALGAQYGMTAETANIFAQSIANSADATTPLETAVSDVKDSFSAFTAELDAVNAAIKEQQENGYISAATYQSLIDLGDDYANVLTYENGAMRLNTDALSKLTDGKKAVMLAEIEVQKVEAQQQYAENASRIQELANAYMNLTPEQHEELATLQSENSTLIETIGYYNALTGEVNSATSAYDDFTAALSSEDQGANYETLIKALDTVQDGLKTGKVNTDQYKEGLKLLFGESVPDDLGSALKDLSKFITEDDDAVSGIIKKFESLDDSVIAVKKDAEGNISFDIPDLDKLADKLGTSKETVEGILGLLEEYGDVSFTDTEEGVDGIQQKTEDTNTTVDDLNTTLDNLNKVDIGDLGFDNLSSDIQNSIDKINTLIKRLLSAKSLSPSSGYAPKGGEWATGTNSAPGGPALVGEEGVETRISDGKVGFVGQNGPEIIELKRGDTILTNDETKSIVKNGKINAFATGASGSFKLPKPSQKTKKKGSSKSSKSSKESEEEASTYIDELKKYFNIQEDILDAEKETHEETIKSINDQINAQNDLISTIEEKAKKQQEVIDDQIKAQNELLNALNEQYATEDRLAELEKARQKLVNIQAEKIRLYSEEAGGFIWTVDPQAVAEQQEVISKLEQEIAREEEKAAIKATIAQLEDQKEAIQDTADAQVEATQSIIDSLELQKKSEQTIIDQLKEKQDLMSEFASDIGLLDDEVRDNIDSWNELIDAMSSAGIAYQDISGLWGGASSAETPGGGGTTGKENSKPSAVKGILRKGSKGEDVKKLQRALSALGYSPGSIDGIFGSKTKSAVEKFQKAAGVTADGIVGKNTKEQFRIKGYDKGGPNTYTGLAMLHGSPLHPEYVQSAPDVESMMSSLPALLENMANGGGGGNVNIENFNTSSGNPMTIYRTLRQVGALAQTAGGKRR